MQKTNLPLADIFALDRIQKWLSLTDYPTRGFASGLIYRNRIIQRPMKKMLESPGLLRDGMGDWFAFSPIFCTDSFVALLVRVFADDPTRYGAVHDRLHGNPVLVFQGCELEERFPSVWLPVLVRELCEVAETCCRRSGIVFPFRYRPERDRRRDRGARKEK